MNNPQAAELVQARGVFDGVTAYELDDKLILSCELWNQWNQSYDHTTWIIAADGRTFRETDLQAQQDWLADARTRGRRI